MDDQAWASVRKRLRTRTSRQMMLIICPLIFVVALLKIVEPMDYPVGDLRNTIPFRFAFYGLFISAAVVGFLVSVRWLIVDRRRD